LALKATIFKAELQVSDMDRSHYASYHLTLARHPSETDQRMLVRLIAFALNADELLTFTKGISSDDEPDLWQKSLSDEIELWIELGQPDEKRIRRACGRARKVVVYPFAARSAGIWWEQIRHELSRFGNLNVTMLSLPNGPELEGLVQRNMHLHATIQEGQVWLGDEKQTALVDLQEWQ
jgi:uncharacterized protein YaeQ